MDKKTIILNEVKYRYSNCFCNEDYLKMIEDVEKKYNCSIDAITWHIKIL
jgi:hypothetical protein